MTVQTVIVYNRADCCGSRLSKFEVRVGESTSWKDNAKCGNYYSVPQGSKLEVNCNGLLGSNVFVVLEGEGYLTLCEVKVVATMAGSNCEKCATEGNQCKLTQGAVSVKYGKDNKWVEKQVVSSTDYVGCNNGVFGDPLVGKRKDCLVCYTTPPTPNYIGCFKVNLIL